MDGSPKTTGQAQPARSATGGYYAIDPVWTVAQPAAAGQLEAVAAQLAAAYGGTPADYLTQMRTYYAPMRLADYAAAHDAARSERAAAAPTAMPTGASTPSSGPASAGRMFVHDPDNPRGGPY